MLSFKKFLISKSYSCFIFNWY